MNRVVKKSCWKQVISLFTLSILLLSFTAVPVAAADKPAIIKTQAAADSIAGGIRGIDVSKYQGEIDWPKVAQNNVNFVIARASIGTATDPTFAANVQGASAQGIPVGAYHYARFSDRKTMKQEAELFLSEIGGVTLSYPVFLDIEDNKDNRSLTKQELTSLCIEFLNLLKQTGYSPMIYSGSNFIADRLDRSQLSSYYFWIANYVKEPDDHRVIWQHTSSGKVNGIKGNVCIEIAYTDLSYGQKRTVNRDASTSIKETLNIRYSAGLPLDGLDMGQMSRSAVSGLQAELIRQLGATITVTGQMNEDTLSWFEQITFTKGKTKGNITYLIQAMLFYGGYYSDYPSGKYDDAMVQAISSLQKANGMETTGYPDRNTISILFS